jgi:uncharacterized lipoprotein YddW (UPF0748 family)
MRRILVLGVCLLAVAATAAADPVAAVLDRPMRAVRFDPAFYYGTGRTTPELARWLVDTWTRANINTVYFLTYSHVYGARYQTDYADNILDGFGVEDLLGVMLPLLKERGIKVIAWFADHQHKGAWDAHPEWRVLEQDGSYYRDTEWDYYLSVRRPDVRAYLQGFVADLLTNYPDLDGVDITEPIVNWWGNRADFSDYAVDEFARRHPGASFDGPEWKAFRAESLTIHIREMVALIHAMGKEAHVTTVFTAAANGDLLSAAQLRDEIGFDLDAVLSGADRPDYLNGEVMWQTWREVHGNSFTPEWTRKGVRQAAEQVASRVPFVAHVELTPYGGTTPTMAEFARSLRAAIDAGAMHLDFYDSFQADTLRAWPAIRREYAPRSAIATPETLALRVPVALESR